MFISLPSFELQMSYERWEGQGPEPTIALHGWLDNCNSFNGLAPLMADSDIYGLDFFGHGLSDHLPAAGIYHISIFVRQLHEFAKQMGFDKFHLLCHSMGAGIATLYAGSFPEQVLSLRLVEGLAPMVAPHGDIPDRFRSAIDRVTTKGSRKPVYKSFEEACAARAEAGPISLDAAKELANRGLVKHGEEFTWRTDPRLLYRSVHPLAPDQVLEFVRRIECPVTLVLGEQGFIRHFPQVFDVLEHFKNLNRVDVAGRHHVHLEDPQVVAKALRL